MKIALKVSRMSASITGARGVMVFIERPLFGGFLFVGVVV